MEFNVLMSNGVTANLRCEKCLNFLSYFPITISFDCKSVCGRCVLTSEDYLKEKRNVAYETVAQFIKFPCRFQSEGCCEDYYPKDVPGHEEICPYRQVGCFVFTSCSWRGSYPKVIQHCQDEHNDLMLRTNEQFELDLCSSNECENIVEDASSSSLFVFKRKFDAETKVLQCAVTNCPFEISTKQFPCTLTVKSKNKSLQVEFQATNLQELTFTELFLEMISTCSQDPVFGKITFTKPATNANKKTINSDMLAVLQCFECNNLILPPIYQCQNDTTLCSNCLENHTRVCQQAHHAMNISLTKMANLLDYPCQYQRNGCPASAKPEKIAFHLQVCEFGNIECPLNEFDRCQWTGQRRNVTVHIKEDHKDFLQTAAEIKTMFSSKRMKYAIIKFADCFFRLVYMKVKDRYCWTVQIICPHKSKFKYEIEIMDAKESGRKLLVRQPCQSLLKKEELFKTADTYCFFLQEQVVKLQASSLGIRFKVHIFKEF